MPREILRWRHNVERALRGLDLTTGTAQHNMTKQFMRGSALITYESATLVLLINRKADAIVHAETQFAAHPAHRAAGHGALIFQGL